MTAFGFRIGRTLALAVMAGVITACATDPQLVQIKRLERLGFLPVSDVAQAGAPRAMTYSGEIGNRVTCTKNGEKIRVTDQDLPSTIVPGATIRQDSSLDSYIIVNGDGSTEGTHIVTLVRMLEDNGKMMAREVVTTEIGVKGSAELGELGTCIVA